MRFTPKPRKREWKKKKGGKRRKKLQRYRRRVREKSLVPDAKPKLRQADPSYVFEPRPNELNSLLIRGYGPLSNPIELKQPFRPIVYAISWGWNSGGRCFRLSPFRCELLISVCFIRAGNVTAENIHIPSQVQKSITETYIAAAAGTHHSLLVSDKGLVYSFGEGDKGQLGYGNMFNSELSGKGGKVQSFPRQVNPSGELKYGCDIKVSQVGCGRFFSVAREVCGEEGGDLYRGLREMENALASMKAMYGDSDKVAWSWAQVRQERFKVSQICQGLVTTWGTGEKGQLGLGKYVTYCPHPQVIPALRNVSIVNISVGKEHVLAICSNKFLYR